MSDESDPRGIYGSTSSIPDLPDLPPLESGTEEMINWIKKYLNTIISESRPRTHLFTVNQLTYPFVRDLHFAAVPNYPPFTGPSGVSYGRPLEMRAGLSAVNPGDLMFFYISERQRESLSEYGSYQDELECRRGIAGLFRAVSDPYICPVTRTHPDTGYELRGECPTCGTTFGWFRNQMADDENYVDYWCAGSRIQGKKDHQNRAMAEEGGLMTPLRIDLEPVSIFRIPIVDNRAYSDFTGRALVWVSRFDNTIGRYQPGKGSTIRHLLPEESVELVRMLMEENDEEFQQPEKTPAPSPERWRPLTNIHGNSVRWLNWDETDEKLVDEHFLDVYFSRNIDRPGSNIDEALDVLEPENVEYCSWQFPWGFAGDQSDFLCLLKREKRYRALHFEFKAEKANNDAMIKMMLYVPWIAQAAARFAEPRVNQIEIVPILVGTRPVTRKPHRLHVAEEHSFDMDMITGEEAHVEVSKSKVLRYSPAQVERGEGDSYAIGLEFEDITEDLPSAGWPGYPSMTATTLERKWVKKRWPPDD